MKGVSFKEEHNALIVILSEAKSKDLPPSVILTENLSLYHSKHKIICYNNHITSEYTKETYGKEESNF